jgi:hypothetical protein
MRTRTLELGSNDAKDLNTLTNPTLTEMQKILTLNRSETEDENGIPPAVARVTVWLYGSNGQPTYEFMSTASCVYLWRMPWNAILKLSEPSHSLRGIAAIRTITIPQC